MIDILMYLFETYGHVDACPQEPEQLTRKLAAAGFQDTDISEAVEWFSGLRRIAQTSLLSEAPSHHAIRIYNDLEVSRLSLACRGFLTFLENSGVLNTSQREMIIERALAFSESDISLSKFKIIVLMVLWHQQADLSTLIIEELLTEELDDDEEEEEGDWDEIIPVH